MLQAKFYHNNNWEKDDICHIYPYGLEMFFIIDFKNTKPGLVARVKSMEDGKEFDCNIYDLQVNAADAMTGPYRGTL